jgi:ADP-heptose:LPS heptosyltransferase
MKIPGLDSLVYRSFWALDRLGRIRTVRDLADANLDAVDGIVVAVTTALGDSICFTPALQALRSRFPRARIVGLFHHAFAELYRQDPRLDAVIPYWGKYVRWRETVRSLRAARCELALVPYIADPDVIPLLYLGGSRIIFRTPGRDTIYRFMVANPELLSDGFNPEHALVRVATMLRYLGAPVTDLAPRLHMGDTQREDAEEWLQAHGIPPGVSLVGMHPGASIQKKRWPAGNFAAAARALLADDAERWLLLTGSRGERALCEDIRQACGAPERVVNAAGELPLTTLPAVLERVRWFLGNDTGVAHVAYAMDIPSLTLFWRSDPERSGPLHHLDRHRVIARTPLCPPCRTRDCRYPDCANEITVDRVLDDARAMLSRPAVAGHL